MVGSSHSPGPNGSEPRIGIVLGAGGPVGWAYHLGVVEGIREAVGCTPAQARRLVGTSAGGAVGASLLAGADSAEILSSISQPMAPADRERVREARSGLFRRSPRSLRPQAPRLVTRGGAVGLVGLLPPGVFPTFPLRRFPTDGLERWPPSLWLPSVRLDDGQVVVFGRDRTDVAVADAVEATSAVPGMFRPKEIGDERYIDGAVASATHADLLIDEGLDLVLLSSPMTRPGRGLVKGRARRQVRSERERLHRVGTRTVLFEPSPAIMARAEGFPRSNPEAGRAIVEAARRQVVEVLAANG